MQNLIGSIQAPQQNLAGMFGNSPIVQSFSQMLNQANQANASRGQNILSLLQGQGTAQMQLNQTNEQNQEGQINQDMMSKGIAKHHHRQQLEAGGAEPARLEQ